MGEIVNNNFDKLQLEQISILKDVLDSQYKFAKEFNSELQLRLKLLQAGYKGDQDSIPGLLDLEEESLKVYLSILFKQYFKQGKQDNLFELCSKMLKDYSLKHSELVSINSKPKQVKQQPRDPQSLKESEISVLHKQELEKQIAHLSPIIHQVVLEKMLQLSNEQL